jgi:hypothetical protein
MNDWMLGHFFRYIFIIGFSLLALFHFLVYVPFVLVCMDIVRFHYMLQVWLSGNICSAGLIYHPRISALPHFVAGIVVALLGVLGKYNGFCDDSSRNISKLHFTKNSNNLLFFEDRKHKYASSKLPEVLCLKKFDG